MCLVSYSHKKKKATIQPEHCHNHVHWKQNLKAIQHQEFICEQNFMSRTYLQHRPQPRTLAAVFQNNSIQSHSPTLWPAQVNADKKQVRVDQASILAQELLNLTAAAWAQDHCVWQYQDVVNLSHRNVSNSAHALNNQSLSSWIDYH